jgi:hypothetical protein
LSVCCRSCRHRRRPKRLDPLHLRLPPRSRTHNDGPIWKERISVARCPVFPCQVVAIASRAWRRHVNTCCGVSPWRRATSETTAPERSVSATTRALKSSVKRRRRPVPVITSSRRTSATSGSSLWSSVDTKPISKQRSHNRKSAGIKGGVATTLTEHLFGCRIIC